MKKRFFRILSVLLVLTALLPLSVRADVISEPDDDFVQSHRDECRPQQYRTYVINSPEGYAALWESPVSSRQRETLANGEKVSGEWRYTGEDGETWLLIEGGVDGVWKERGWVKLSECIPALGAITFNERHGGEYTAYDGSFDEELAKHERIVVWTYPCSGVVAYKDLDVRAILDGAHLSCWRDPEGRIWGYSGYVQGDRDVWICLSDPVSTDIPANPDVLPRLETIYPPIDKLPAPNRSGVTGTAVALVAGLSVVTVGLLWFFFARRKKSV